MGHEQKSAKTFDSYLQDPSFCFQSALWKSAIQLEIELQTVYRQSEPELLDLLCEVRNGGNLSAADVDLLSSREMKVDPWVDVALGCINLFPHNVDCDRVNSIVLDSLPGTAHTFAAKDTGSKGKQVLNKRCPAKETLCLMVGCRVMLLINMRNDNLVNGSIGNVVRIFNDLPVVGFEGGGELTIKLYIWSVKDENGFTIATRQQLPLAHRYASTFHKLAKKFHII